MVVLWTATEGRHSKAPGRGEETGDVGLKDGFAVWEKGML